MIRAEWDAYNNATGSEKKRLLTRLLAGEERYACSYVAEFVRRTNYHCDDVREDLLQAARIGIMRAIDRWEPHRGAFSTTAYFQMRHELQQVLRHVTPISRPRSADLPRKAQDAAATFSAKHGRDPEPHEIGLADSAIRRAEKAAAKFVRADWPTAEGGQSPEWENIEAPQSDLGPEASLDLKRDLRALATFTAKLAKWERRDLEAGTVEMVRKARAYVEKRRSIR